MTPLLERLAELERTCVKHRLGSATIETAQLSALLRVVDAADRFVTTNMELYKDTGEAFALQESVRALRALEAPRG